MTDTQEEIKQRIVVLEQQLKEEKAKLGKIYAEEAKRITKDHYDSCSCNFCRVRIHYETPEECECTACRERIMLDSREKAISEGRSFLKADPAEEVKPHRDLNCPYYREGGCTKCMEFM